MVPAQTDAALRARLTVAEDALRAIAAPACMVVHEDGESWIDTGIPEQIAAGALECLREMEAVDAP